MNIERFKKDIFAYAKKLGAEFKIVVGTVEIPEVKPNWIEPEDFNPETDDYPVTGNMKSINTVGWKDEYKDEIYGQFMVIDNDLSVEELYYLLEDNHARTMFSLRRKK